MKSIVVCENSYGEQKTVSNVLKEKGNERKSTKSSLNDNVDNQKPVTAIETSDDSLKFLKEDSNQKDNNISDVDIESEEHLKDKCEKNVDKSTYSLCITENTDNKVNGELNCAITNVACPLPKIESSNKKAKPMGISDVGTEENEINRRSTLEECKNADKQSKSNQKCAVEGTRLSEKDAIENCCKVIDLEDNEPSTNSLNTIGSSNAVEIFIKDSKKENEKDVEEVILEIDENKENKKLIKNCNVEKMCVENISESDLKCEIEAEDCQSTSKSEEKLSVIDCPPSKLVKPCESKSLFSEGAISKLDRNFKSATGKLSLSENLEQIESQENQGKDLDIEEIRNVDESDLCKGETNCDNIECKQGETLGVNSEKCFGSYESEESKENKIPNDMMNLKKRQVIDDISEVCSKKQKLEEPIKEVDTDLNKKKFDEKGHTSSPSTSVRFENSTESEETKRKSTFLNFPIDKSKSSTIANISNKQINGTSQQMKEAPASSFLASLRGTLKTLTRSDLEELIVQKLCEVITERSVVGELRRKAQALEEDQEKWKAKAQSLSKQMKEMEMVMRKYMSEVQKHTKDGSKQSVVPLRVTRSVGLQVSFFSNGNKAPKRNMSLPNSNSNSMPSSNSGTKIAKSVSSKQPSHQNTQIQNSIPKSKPGPASHKNLTTPHKSYSQNQKKPASTPRFNFNCQPRHPNPQAVINSRTIPNQNQVKSNFKVVSPLQSSLPPHLQPQQQQPSQPHQTQVQQNNSKVIDLTDDDDKQSAVVVKSPDSVRAFNHAPQPQISQANRFTYLLPTNNATSPAPTTPSNRPILLATPTAPQPNKQIMSMPPLLFKGGNVPQPGSQPSALNQPNRVILCKPLKHPAPLPQQPVSQYQKPNSKLLPPRPALKISKVQTGIVLSWNMSLSPEHAPISSYQLYAYQEGNTPPATSLWKKVGDVKALPLPMACTLTQFMSGHKYHFAVRAVDSHSRIGPFSFPGTIVLVK